MASGKHAFGICDRTGFRYKLSDLVWEYVHGTRTGLRIGKDVADKDHPQNFIGTVDSSDNTSLTDPRPDTVRGDGLHGWNPIWNDAQSLTMSLGSVTVTLEAPE